MGRKDSSSAAEAKLLEFTALMNHDYSQRPSGPRKALHSRSTVVTKPLRSTTDKPRRIDTNRTVLPILNLAKVRHNLADEAADLATTTHNENQKEEDPLDLTKQAKAKLNVHQFLSSSQHLPTAAQTQRRSHVKTSKGGSLALRGMTAPESLEKREVRKLLASEGVAKVEDGPSWAEPRRSQLRNWRPGRGVVSAGNARGFSTAERMQLEEKLKLKLKTPRPLPEDITAESEACHRQSSNTFLYLD